MTFTLFSSYSPVFYTELPFQLMNLNEWSLVNVIGQDSEKYLQSQVTANIMKMSKYQHIFTANCNSKGKVLSSINLFRHGEGFAFIVRYSLRDIQIKKLKKYSVFSKVNIFTDEKMVLIGIAGFQARKSIKNLFQELPTAEKQVVSNNITTLLWFQYPLERFLLVADIVNAERVIRKLRNIAQLNDSQQWIALNIEAGLPIIDFVNSEKFIPQSINLKKLGGISFKKGCYIGQEAVAKAEFRGVNKRSLRHLLGKSDFIPSAGDGLEMQAGKGWRRVGTILAVIKLKDGRLLIQTVMNEDVTLDNLFCVRKGNDTVSIKLFPYSCTKI